MLGCPPLIAPACLEAGLIEVGGTLQSLSLGHAAVAHPSLSPPGDVWVGQWLSVILMYELLAPLTSLLIRTVWPSGLRRWLKAPVRKGVGSNPTAVISLALASFDSEPTSLMSVVRDDHTATSCS